MKKLITCIAVLGITLGAAFAQTSGVASYKRVTTGSVFETDVDNFSSVINWSKVNPETFFGMLGYNGYGVQLGAAKNFKPGYFAFYLEGDLGWQFDNTTEKTKNGDKFDVTKTEEDNTSNFDFSVLYGTGKTAFKLGLLYEGDSSDKQESVNDKTHNDRYFYTVSPSFSFGTEVTVKDTLLKPFASLTYTANKDKTFTADDSVIADKIIETLTDNSNRSIELIYGTEIDFQNKNKYSHNLTIGGSSGFLFYPKTSYSVTGDDSVTNILVYNGASQVTQNITSIYSGKYAATEKLSLGFNVISNITFSSLTEPKSESVTTGTNTVSSDIPYDKEGTFDWINRIGLGLTYTPKKNIDLNFGANVHLPTLRRDTTKSYNADHELTSSKSEWTGNASNLSLGLTSGATFTIGNVVFIDVYTELLDTILSSTLESQWDTSSDADAFWGNVNRVLFPTFGIQVSTKF